MHVEEYEFHLPEHLIAQSPLEERSASRLLMLNRQTKQIEHDRFSTIKKHFKKGDCLVLNNTRVIPARLYGKKEDTGAKIELLLLHEQANDVWEALVRPARKVKKDTILTFGDGKLQAQCLAKKEHGGRVLQLTYKGALDQVLDELGEMPLPPYIKETLEEQERYQTIYAEESGSVAAPTAGLHFTEELLEEIKSMGVEIVEVTLHVGLGTFRPVHTKNVEDHVIHKEYYHLPKTSADRLNKVRKNGGRMIAVGTTVTRVLETVARENNGSFTEAKGWTDIFIYPPYEFKAIDGLITNFHLPKSTLFMLVCAFVDRETMIHAYEQAIDEEYRFFSFGDAMFITA